MKKTLNLCTAMLLIALLEAPTSGARAADFIVDSNLDDGSSGTLRWAITQANAGIAPHTISLPEMVITLGSALPPIEKATLIQGVGGAASVVEGAVEAYSVDTQWPVISVAAGAVVTIRDLTIRNGVDVVVGDNPATGGGIVNLGDLTLDRVTVSHNLAYSPPAGVISREATGGGIFNMGSLTLIESKVSNNRLEIGLGILPGAARGGGVYSGEGADLYIEASTISDNVVVAGRNLTGGFPGSSYGGGIYIELNSTAEISRTTISGNLLTDFFDSGAYNGVLLGGGLFVRDEAANSVLVRLSTISGNIANGYFGKGGGVYSWQGLTLDSCTIADNKALSEEGGGGLYAQPVDPPRGPLVRNTIIAGNFLAISPLSFPVETAGTDTNDVFGRIESRGFNLIQFLSPGGEINTTASGNTGDGNILGEFAQLLPLLDNYGPTKTHALRFSSPAIDAGVDTLVDGSIVDVDQRGLPRTADGSVRGTRATAPDIGAFERQGPTAAVGTFDLYK